MKESSNRKRKFIKTCSFGSLIGTTIEFFLIYIYANAAVLVFPQLFFLQRTVPIRFFALATFSIAFLSRPLGSAVFAIMIRSSQNYAGNRFVDHGISTVSIGF
jgi:hypothetical protein